MCDEFGFGNVFFIFLFTLREYHRMINDKFPLHFAGVETHCLSYSNAKKPKNIVIIGMRLWLLPGHHLSLQLELESKLELSPGGPPDNRQSRVDNRQTTDKYIHILIAMANAFRVQPVNNLSLQQYGISLLAKCICNFLHFNCQPQSGWQVSYTLYLTYIIKL